jgi:2-polyprenyl-6-methoxyphenol hydroxylase-like FAD-dependent oxidoreductase
MVMTTQGDRQRELLVVGAGPVGLCAALCAARAGLDVEVIDQSFRGFGRGYATLLHPAAVHTLDRLGVGEKLRRAGREISGIGLRADGSERMRLELPSPALAVAQGALEQTLLTALRELDVPLSAPCEASTILQESSKVSVRVVRRELVTYGSPAEYSDWAAVESSLVHADFVIGADGYESRVRTALGIDCATLGETESFAMFEVPAHEDSSRDIELGFSGGLVSAVIPLPEGRTRLGFQLDSGLDLEPDAGRLHDLVSARTPWLRNGQQQIDWGTVIHFERRLVRRFGVGRVWLAGDAAHVTSPFGAQSMNLGLLEADQFVSDVARCVHGRAPLETVHEHGAERLREWHKLLGYNVRFDLLANAPSWLPSYARRVAPVLPASGPDLRKVLEQVGLRLS